jgi:hypothetical protein
MAGVEPAGGVDHGTDQRRRVIATNAAWEFACGTGSGQGQPPVAAADSLRSTSAMLARDCRPVVSFAPVATTLKLAAASP